MIGFIFLSNSDFENAKKYADQCLTLNPENIFAEYVIARSAEPTDH
jgi:hypothetical protein